MAHGPATPGAYATDSRLRPELIIIVGGLIASAHASVMITIPAMPRFMDLLGAVGFIGTSLALGLALASSSIGRFLTNIPAGMLSERIGRKPVILMGALLIAVFGTSSGWSPDAVWFWAFRFLIGVGSAMTITIANVVAADLSHVENRGRVLGLMHGMQLIVGIATPGLGGLLAGFVDLRAPFFLSGAGVAVFALWGLFRLPETRPVGGEHQGASSRRSFGGASLLRDPSFLAVCLIGFSTFFLRNGGSTGLIPAYLDDVLKMDPEGLGVLFTIASVIHGVIVYPAGWAADKWGRKPIIVPIGLVVGVAFAVTPLMQTLAPFTVVFIILHTAIGWGGQAPMAYIGDISPPGQRGVAFGMYRTWGDAAGIIGPIIALGLADWVGYEEAFWFGAALWTATVIYFWKVAKESAGPRRTHHRTTGEHAHATPRTGH